MTMARTYKDRHDMNATGNHSMYDSWQRYEKRTIEKDFEYFIYKEEDAKDQKELDLKIKCFRCNGTGLIQRDAWDTKSPTGLKSVDAYCPNCGGKG
jgi:ribosomal protein L44E